MNFLMMSDLHLEYEPIDFSITGEVDAVILAGDIAQGTDGIRWAEEVFYNIPVIFIAGNHEFYGYEVTQVTQAFSAATKNSNVQWLEKRSTILGNVRILGTTLWTDFAFFAGTDEKELAWSMADCRRYVPDFDGRIRWLTADSEIGLTPEITRDWHFQSVAWLQQELATPFPGKTLVVTHHAPSNRSVAECYSRHPATPAWASQLDHLVKQADAWCHGHMHEAYDYKIGKCQVRCNPRGYGNESSLFDPGWLLKV